MHSHRQIFTHSIVFNQYTSKYRNGGFCKKNLLGHNNIRITESIILFSPSVFLLFMVKKQQRGNEQLMFLRPRLNRAGSKHDFAFFDFVQTHYTLFPVHFQPAMIHLVSLELLPSISMTDWFQQSCSAEKGFVFDPRQNRKPVLFAALFPVHFNMLCASKRFSFSPFSPFKTKSLVNQRQPICTSVVKLLANIDAKVTLKMYLCNQCILD